MYVNWNQATLETTTRMAEYTQRAEEWRLARDCAPYVEQKPLLQNLFDRLKNVTPKQHTLTTPAFAGTDE